MPKKNQFGESVLSLNRMLCESKVRQAVEESISSTCVAVSEVTAESSGDDPGLLYEGKVFQCDRVNANNRVYPLSLMKREVAKFQPLMKEGRLCGSVDHGTGLKNQAVIWREMWIDSQGAGRGKFEIVPTRVGKDLQIQCKSGMSVGFSTYGYGNAHIPSESERAKYGLPPHDPESDGEAGNPENPYTGPVIMNDDEYESGGYSLEKIDPVDIPAVHDARVRQSQAKSTTPVIELNEEFVKQWLAEGKAVSEACDNGLHWVQLGTCGHTLSECRCESDKKHYIYSDKKCEKCANTSVVEGLTTTEFKQVVTESKSKRAVAEKREVVPLAKTYSQYVAGRDSFEPVGPIKLAPELKADAYQIVSTWDGVRFVRKPVQTDELYHFEGSPTESVLKEIDDFWGAKENYDKYNITHRRGCIMEGGPGNGKSASIQQAVDLVTGRGDVVFYGRNVSVLKEGLDAFREVEPDRKVVVVLEDADEYVGYQERDMLNLLDGADTVGGVFYLATTNYLEAFPPRLRRTGRFDRIVHVPSPNEAGRKAYLTHKLGKVETAEEIESLAKSSGGFTFGDLKELIVAIYALKEPKQKVLDRLKGASKNAASRLVGRTQDSVGDKTTKVTPNLKGRGAKVMKDIVEHLNTFLASIKDSGIELPQREVLPAELATRLESSSAKIDELESSISKVTAEKAELHAKLDTITAERAEEVRTAAVMTKASDLLKESRFADAILDDVKDAMSDKSFVAEKVDALVKAKTARYEKVAGKQQSIPAAALPTGHAGATVTDDELNDFDDAADEASEDVNVGGKVEEAKELNW